MKKGAIFDMDGLMFDTEVIYGRAWRLAGERLGFTIPDGFHTAVSGSSGENMKQIIRSFLPGVDCEAFIELTYQISYDIQRHTLPEKPGLHEILEFFRGHGVKMAVASSTHREQVEWNLERSGIRSYFDAVVTGQDVSHSKPDPEAFLTASAQLGLSASDCYVFEDSFNGVRAGHAASCCTIMIPDLRQPDQEIAQLYDACVPDLLTAVQQIQKGVI